MSFNQDVRFSDSVNSNNPHNLFEWIKPSRTITGSGAPASNLGEDEWLYIDTSTAIEWIKQNGVWSQLVNFSSIVVPADPLVLNSIHVNEIQTDNSGAVQINLQTTDILNIGPALDNTAVQIQANGVISSSAAAGTSSLFLGDGAGNQLSMDPSILTISGSPNLNLFASNNAVITANAGSITAQCGTTVDVSAPSGVTVFTNASGTFFNDGLGTILKVLPNSITMNGAGNLDIASDNIINLVGGTGLTLSTTAGQITMNPAAGAVVVQPAALVVDTIFSGTTIGIAATTGLSESGSTVSITSNVGNVTLNSASDINMIAASTITSSVPFYSGSGTSAAPTYSFSADSNSGVTSLGADILGFCTGGSTRVFVENSDMTSAVHILPFVDNTFDLGSGAPQFAWRNIYSNNLLNVVSDERVKRDIEECKLGKDFIEDLSPIAYRLNSDADDSKLHFGLIAQRVKDNMEIHAYESNKYDMVNSEGDVYSLKYESILMPMINAIKEMSNEIKQLKSKINN